MGWTKITSLGTPGGGDAFVYRTYTRPSDWLALPTVTASDQKFVGLYAVFNNTTNYLALKGYANYTVDWGDGSGTQNFSSGVLATHQYTYASISSGTTTTEGFRQVIVTVTPQAGQNLTGVDINQKHTASPLSTGTSGWLDIRVAGSNLGANFIVGYISYNIVHAYLEQFEFIGTCAKTDYSYFFSNCYQLRKVIGSSWLTTASSNMTSMFSACYSLLEFNASVTGVTNFSSAFQNCRSLQRITLNSTAATNFASTFASCYSLREATVNLANATSCSSMFQTCYSLIKATLTGGASNTSCSNMFYQCYSLSTAPTITTSNVTDFSYMFYVCSALATVGSIDVTKATTIAHMFDGCSSLSLAPTLNPTTAAAVDANSVFSGCYSLKSVPVWNTSKVTNLSNAFSNCFTLRSVPLWDTSKVTNFSQVFGGCQALTEVPAWNMGLGTTFSSTFFNCVSLTRMQATGISKTVDFSNCRLSNTALDEIYTNLASGVTGQTITVTGNVGIAADTPSIATGKGWTVTGS